MSGRLELRQGVGPAVKRRSGGGGASWGLLLLLLGAVLVVTPCHIAASSGVALRSAPASEEVKTVRAPEGPPPSEQKLVPAPEPETPLDRMLDGVAEKVKGILRRSPKMLGKLNTVLKTRMDLENKIANRILKAPDVEDSGVDEQLVTETANILRSKLFHSPVVGYKVVILLEGAHPNTLEDLEDSIRNMDLSQGTPVA